MPLAVRGAFWIGIYLAVAVVPLVFAVLGESPPARGFLIDFSVALGFVGLSMMGLQFALVARFQHMVAPFGEDAVVQFHRQISPVATVFILAHPLLLLVQDTSVIGLFNPVTAPWRARFAVVSTVCLLAIMFTSIWRRRLHIRYETWQGLHTVLAIASVLFALAHILLVGRYVDTPWKRVLWAVMTAAFVGLIVWVRLVRPLRRLRRPWEVARVSAERGETTTVTLRPVGHEGFRFEPGQFGWITVGRSPFALTQHPFSFSSSAEAVGGVQMSIKALGDFTRSVTELRTGTRAYLDGPHGVFTPDRNEGPGFVLIAGGIGITPAISMLRTFADRDDPRPCHLFYASRTLDDATFLEEVRELEVRLNLTLVLVLEDPPQGWTGERGRIDEPLLQKWLPKRYPRMQFFICGPPPMLDAMESTLARVGVPTAHIHTERFFFV
ncbi:ferric reductase-like transmembrane domain-containing protein [Actinomadura sp. 7K534]|uniref:ferredoxin reductase family protein n=1 Tax=Actinomadura sp. 7K534 TaxID=2530366 RepID=UPI00104817A4|nr:ferric reductase-like transmembrane domain-containing protein [Actinomadura sp. 7K534]TDB93508.1 oxidoreductase [Actinomadura sp. 7K534]